MAAVHLQGHPSDEAENDGEGQRSQDRRLNGGMGRKRSRTGLGGMGSLTGLASTLPSLSRAGAALDNSHLSSSTVVNISPPDGATGRVHGPLVEPSRITQQSPVWLL